MTFKTILTTISVLLILEGIFIVFFPAQTKIIFNQMFKNKKQIRKIGLIEVIIGLVILIVAMITN